jgi:hypothetical protein
MRGPLRNYFQDTVRLCFNVALYEMGPIAREAIFDQLEKRGIREHEVGARFDEAAGILLESFGKVARIIIYKTLAEVCEEYSFPVDFTFEDSLVEKFVFFKDRVLADHLSPRRVHRALPENLYLAPTYTSTFDAFEMDPRKLRG